MKNLLKIVLVIGFFFQYNLMQAQNNATFAIKEQYDKLITDFVKKDGSNPCKIDPAGIPDVYGDGMSFILESYIKMYETTKDKAYLIKFITNSICMHENRQDALGTTNNPRWANSSIYLDGLAIWPMSHFVYKIIIEEPALKLLPLPQIQNTKITSNAFGATFKTYGDFADWLRIRIEETLDWYTYGPDNYWRDDSHCYIPSIDHTDRALQINMQAGFACALFYLGLSDPNTDYLKKAANIANAYKGIYWECSGAKLFYYPVLKLQSNNSYVWKTNGWRKVTCKESRKGENDYEDTSHAITGLLFPRAIYDHPDSNFNMLFNTVDMTRFRNTFSFNVYAGNSATGCPQFHTGVDGDDICNYDSDFNGLNTLKNRSLAWMPFYKFDSFSTSPNVYDIVMKYYSCDILNNINNVASGLDCYGLSEVVSAQWNKECTNLKLYNRDVIYNQDFTAKNKLIIAPEPEQASTDNLYSLNDLPFAEPLQFNDGGNIDRFVVEQGITVNFTAGESIIFRPGTTLKAGSNVNAHIVPSVCTDGL